MTTPLQTVLYTAKTHTTGGRDGHARSDDGALEVRLSMPKGLGGVGGATNPEQLFAAGYSACFLNAVKHVAHGRKLLLPATAAVEAEVDLGPTVHGFGLAVRLAVSLPGIDAALARDLVEAAHAICPYSNATRGNIEVAITVV